MVIVRHEPKDAVNHPVLKVNWPIHGGDLTGEVVPDTKVLRPPRNSLPHADQTGGDSGQSYGCFSVMDVTGKMNFNTSREIETSIDSARGLM